MQKRKKSYKISFFLYFLIFGVVVELITLFVIYGLNHIGIKSESAARFNLEKTIKKDSLSYTLNSAKNSIDAVLNNQDFINYIKSSDQQNSKKVKNSFLYVLNSNYTYVQLRYLNKAGQEKIRIDKSKITHHPFIVADIDLQNKSNRYYYKQIMKTKNDKYWYSDLDLNIENGKIEIPYVPTLRIAKKVDISGKNFGFVILNINMQEFVDEYVKSSNFNVALVDGRGNYVYGVDELKNWSANLKKEANVFKEYDVLNQDFTALNEAHPDVHIVPLSDIIPSAQDLHVVFSAKSSFVTKMQKENVFASMIIFFVVVLMSLPVAYFLARAPASSQEGLCEKIDSLEDRQKILEKYTMVLIINAKGEIEDISDGLLEKLSYKKEQLEGKPYTIIIEENAEYKASKKELKYYGKKGDVLLAKQNVIPVYNKDKTLKSYIAILEDVTYKKALEAQSFIDPLTSLINQEKAQELMQREINLIKRYGGVFCVVFAGIDFFKNLNDELSAEIGDKVLVGFARLLDKFMRKTDILARYENEKFLILLPQTDIDGVKVMAEHLRDHIQNHNFKVGKKVTASFGVAKYQEGDDFRGLIRKANDALYNAQDSGRNRVGA